MEKSFVYRKYLEEMAVDKRRNIQIIACYWHIKGFEFKTLEQVRTALREGRLQKAAKNLIVYEDDKIQNTMEWLKKHADFKWTLETVNKYINEDLNKLPTKRHGYI